MILNETTSVSRFFQGKDMAAELAAHFDAVCRHYYRTDSQTFAYDAFAASIDFKHHLMVVQALTQFDPKTLANADGRLAFWVNVYNLLVIHGIIAHKVKRSVRNAKNFYTDTQYLLGGYTLSLDDIEHGILRGNAHKYRGLKLPFEAGDPRLPLVLLPPDARVHFVLYSACKASPLLRVCRPEGLDEQLHEATCYLLERQMVSRGNGLRLRIPKIFYWYKNDFGTDARIVEFIAAHQRDPRSQAFLHDNADRVALGFLDFDWALNKTD